VKLIVIISGKVSIVKLSTEEKLGHVTDCDKMNHSLTMSAFG
jgi:uncharacterized protein YlzI (FlbEa/FlbD family)